MAYNTESVEDEIRILIVGSPGAGKSATGNTILGEDIFEVHAVAHPENIHTNVKTVNRFGKKILVVDTPECLFTDDLKKIPQAQWDEFIEKAGQGPHAIVLVVSAANRFTPKEVQILSRLKQAFQKDFEKFCIVVFTLTETWKRQNYTVETFFETFPMEAQDLLSSCMAQKRAVAFQNSIEDNSQAQQLLEMVENIKKANENQFFRLELLHKPQETERGQDAAPNPPVKRSLSNHRTSAEESHPAKSRFAKELREISGLEEKFYPALERSFDKALEELKSRFAKELREISGLEEKFYPALERRFDKALEELKVKYNQRSSSGPRGCLLL